MRGEGEGWINKDRLTTGQAGQQQVTHCLTRALSAPTWELTSGPSPQMFSRYVWMAILPHSHLDWFTVHSASSDSTTWTDGQPYQLQQPQVVLTCKEVTPLLKHRARSHWRGTKGGYKPQGDAIWLLESTKVNTIYHLPLATAVIVPTWEDWALSTLHCAFAHSLTRPRHTSCRAVSPWQSRENQTWSQGADPQHQAVELTSDLKLTASAGLRI